MNFFRRRHILINKQIQLKFALLTVLLLVLYTLTLVAALFAPYVLTIYADLPVSEKSKAAEMILVLHSSIWPWIGALILLCGILSIFITHKIAGPVFVFIRMTRQIVAGDFTVRARLRKGDGLRALEENLNLMAGNIEAMLTNIDTEYKKVCSYLSKLEKELEAKGLSSGELAELATKTGADKKGIDAILGKYKFGKTP